MNNPTLETQNLFGKTLKGLRKKADLTQDQMALLADGLFKVDSIRKWEGIGENLSLENLKNLIIFFLKRNTFSSGKEQEEAKDLWEKATLKFPGLSLVSFDEKWFDKAFRDFKNFSLSNSDNKLSNISLILIDEINLMGPRFCAAFSMNSQVLATAGRDANLVNFYRVNCEAKLELLSKQIQLHRVDENDRASWIIFSQNGKRLAVVSGNHIVQEWEIGVWELDDEGLPNSFQPRWKFFPETRHIPAIGLDYNGRLLAIPRSNRDVQILDIETSKVLHTLLGAGLAREFIFSKDGKFLAAASEDGTVKLWDIAKQGIVYPLHEFDNHRNGAYTLNFSPDEMLIVSGGADSIINLSYVNNTRRYSAFSGKGHSAKIYSVVFSPDGKYLASAGTDGIIILWEIRTGSELQKIKIGGEDSTINNLAFSPDGRFLISSNCSDDNTLRLWRVEYKEET